MGIISLVRVMKTLQEVAETRRVAIQWIPAHCGISGNEMADQLAKLEAREQHINSVSFAKKKTHHQDKIESQEWKRTTTVHLKAKSKLS